ncbi:hypothetical protein F5X96DRAFT_651801 [Biscogniauxia mediterranea]|nr:hypothetical protein F5X96DRAFT_651801 [Biscogniauxia mediterranea]
MGQSVEKETMKGMWGLDPRCKLKDCKQRRIKGSDYCQKHICKEWIYNRQCFKRGRGPNNRCAEHSNCVKQMGGRKCGKPRKKPDPEYKYCAEIHGCRDDECKAPSIGNRTGTAIISRWCVNHACANTECENPRVGGGQGCREHTCQATGCVLMVPGTKEADKSKVDNFCAVHRTCNKSGCGQPIFVHTSNRNSRFCFEHFCKPGAGACAKERVDGAGAEACEDHTCAHYHLNRACCKPRAAPLPGALYCADHECKRPGCQRERHADKEWCPEHLCSSPLELREDCGNEREGAAANQIYCKDHRPCDEPNCREFRAFKGNVRQEKCVEHSKPKCKYPNCARNPESESLDYCPSHLCQYAQGCRSSPIPGTSICWLHKCAEPPCPFPRVAPPPLVAPFFPGPIAPSSSSNADTTAATTLLLYQQHLAAAGGKVGAYCHLHTCRARDCVRRVFAPSFLSASSSAVPDVNLDHYYSSYDHVGVGGGGGGAWGSRLAGDNGAEGDGGGATTKRLMTPEYCDEHKCRERDCLAAGDRENRGFCRDHGGKDGVGWGNQLGGGRGRRDYYRAIRW